MRKIILGLMLAACLGACGQRDRLVVLHPAGQPPQRLSDWGVIVADGRYLDIGDSVVPYSLNMPLFSDYALKFRTVWMPEGTYAAYRDDGPMDFPVGTIISKTFFYEKAEGFNHASWRVAMAEGDAPLDSNSRLSLQDRVLVETRLLVRYEDGWSAMPYVWNAAQDEASLELAGDIRRITLADSRDVETFTYVVPDANQCAGCHVTDHVSKELVPIGPKAWQLNREYDYGPQTVNQLDHWQASGSLRGVSESPPEAVSWADPDGASLESRSKAYLDVNCAHCHNEAGAADTSALDLAMDTPVDREYGICKPPVAVGRGSGDRPYDIYPGRADDSIMIFRMQHTDPAIAMPELGRSAVHVEGVDLVSAWIASMPGDC